MNVLHPANKVEFTDGQAVEVCLAGDVSTIITGKIAGRATSENIIDYWIVLLDHKIDGYPWSAISVGHVFIRPRGDNRPFLCEGVSRVDEP